MVQNYKPAGVLIGFNCLFASFYDPDVNSSLYDFPIYFINNRAFSKIRALFANWEKASAIQLHFYRKDPPLIDCGMLVILFVAVFGVSTGGLWSGSVHKRLRLARIEEAKKRHETGRTEGEIENDVEPESVSFSYLILFIFLVFTIAFLLLLYFFYEVFGNRCFSLFSRFCCALYL
ncbi:unnamed protein product [Soboliphyme baturini]|uniref:ULP_PROTEASE domain-containing protein n=1 Tax=Soboliphyme baturini TaxID=241478 RepID=A0A183IQ67_9BILA|nr:unnamed protein product [Soboliphyme baturini]